MLHRPRDMHDSASSALTHRGAQAPLSATVQKPLYASQDPNSLPQYQSRQPGPADYSLYYSYNMSDLGAALPPYAGSPQPQRVPSEWDARGGFQPFQPPHSARTPGPQHFSQYVTQYAPLPHPMSPQPMYPVQQPLLPRANSAIPTAPPPMGSARPMQQLAPGLHSSYDAASMPIYQSHAAAPPITLPFSGHYQSMRRYPSHWVPDGVAM